MSTKRYDKEGNLLSYTVSSGETARQNAANAAIFMMLVLLVFPIAPILFAGALVYSYSLQELKFHLLFSILSGVISIGLGIWLVVKFPIVRITYFSIYAGAVGVWLFLVVSKKSDEIWASFWTIIIMTFLYFYFRLVDKKLR